MATLSEVLLAVNKVSESLDTTVEGAGQKVTTILVKVDDRVTARADMVQALKDANLRQGDNDDKNPPSFGSSDFVVGSVPGSTFAGIKIKETNNSVIRFKFKGKRGGSGAGAAETKKFECGQAVYAAIAFMKGSKITSADFNEENIRSASSMYDIDDTIANIKTLSDDWHESCVKGANELWEKFSGLKNKGVKFHRGGAEVKYIEDAFKRVKKEEKVRIDINKWSPADIYVTTKNYKHKCLDEENTLRGLNQCMMHRLIGEGQGPIMFGVSLKKITGKAKLSTKNVDPKTAVDHIFKDFYRKGVNSADLYMRFKSNAEIQFRAFDGPKALTGWQGEVKGASANQGKVGLGSLNLILKLHDLDQVPDVRPILSRGGAARQTLESNVEKLIEKTSPGFTKKKYADLIENKVNKGETEGFYYAMGSSYYLHKIITGITNNDKKNQVCEDIILYASSQSVISAPYYKLE
tara:strand:+ start:209 stop:1603 length:1395 start_codon:yes stop_codon:yes gene_type:complete